MLSSVYLLPTTRCTCPYPCPVTLLRQGCVKIGLDAYVNLRRGNGILRALINCCWRTSNGFRNLSVVLIGLFEGFGFGRFTTVVRLLGLGHIS